MKPTLKKSKKKQNPLFNISLEDLKSSLLIITNKIDVQKYIVDESQTEIRRKPDSRAAEVARHRLFDANREVYHLGQIFLCLFDRIEELGGAEADIIPLGQEPSDNGHPSPAA